MDTPVARAVVKELKELGHTVKEYGALVETPALWSKVGLEVAQHVANGTYDQAVLFCWTGTGISIVANKVKGIRAALCQDAQTAEGARKWNDANVLCMGLRATSEAVAKEILEAWFEHDVSTDDEDIACLRYLEKAEDLR